MSNRVSISRLEIKNLDDGDVCHSIRISDDYETFTFDLFENDSRIPEYDPRERFPEDDKELFRWACRLMPVQTNIMEHCADKGAEIGLTWYDGEDLKDIYDEVFG